MKTDSRHMKLATKRNLRIERKRISTISTKEGQAVTPTKRNNKKASS